MKILWVNPSFLDYRVPVYRRLFDLSGGRFHLIYSKNRVPQRVIAKVEQELGPHAIGLLNETVFQLRGKGDFANTGIRVPYQPGLFGAISKVDADLLIVEGFFQWMPVALLYAKLHRKKIFVAYERTEHTERNCPVWRTWYRKLVSKFLDGFIVNGSLTTEYLTRLGVRKELIHEGAMASDGSTLCKEVNAMSMDRRLTLKAELKTGHGLIYLFVGRVIDVKGLGHLFRAWTRHVKVHPDDSLLIVGDGVLLEQYQREFGHCSSIKFIGGVDYDAIHQYYAISDVFVMPTLEDNWSLVVPEAMACGLPVACSIYNGCHPELVIEGANGKKFDPLKEDTILEALDHFHGADLVSMGAASIRIEKGYSAEVVGQRIFDACQAGTSTVRGTSQDAGQYTN